MFGCFNVLQKEMTPAGEFFDDLIFYAEETLSKTLMMCAVRGYSTHHAGDCVSRKGKPSTHGPWTIYHLIIPVGLVLIHTSARSHS